MASTKTSVKISQVSDGALSPNIHGVRGNVTFYGVTMKFPIMDQRETHYWNVKIEESTILSRGIANQRDQVS